MAILGFDFDAAAVEPSTGGGSQYDQLPADTYLAQIVQSEMQPNKAGTGQFLWLEYEVLEGQYAGAKFENRLNLINPNPQAQDIAQRDLSAICRAVGELRVNDSAQLHFKQMAVHLKVEAPKPKKDQHSGQLMMGADGKPEMWPAKNNVGSHKAVGAAPAARPAAAPQPAVRPVSPTVAPRTATTPAGAVTPPWRRA